MKNKLIQLMSEGYEALFKVPENTTEEEIRSYWAYYIAYRDTNEEELNFEEFMDEFYPEAHFERQFLDEIYL